MLETRFKKIKIKVSFYEKGNKSPVMDFIRKLEKKDREKVVGCLESVEQCGLDDCPRVQFRQIDGKLWEIKIKTSSGGIRIFYTVKKGKELICLHAYKKKSQKAPQQEIKKALRRMKEVLEEDN